MNNRPAGAYIEDAEGNLQPDLTDEAMKTRKEQEEAEAQPATEPPAETAGKKKKEVTADA